MEDLLILTEQEQVKALLHPLRRKILDRLEKGAATPSEVGRAIGVAASKAHYHVRILEKAGLVRLVESRAIGSVSEYYFAPTARRFLVQLKDGRGNIDVAGTVPLLEQVVHDVMKDAHTMIDQGPEAVGRNQMLLSVLPLNAAEADRDALESALALARERFERSVKANPGRGYWLMTAWVPREPIGGDPKEE